MSEQRPEQFRITISEESSNKHLWSRLFTKMNIVLAAITAVVVLSAFYFLLIAFTPIRSMIPGYPDAATKREAIESAIRIDSLERMITRWELYSENLRRVVEGEAPLKVDSLLAARGSMEKSFPDKAAIAHNDSLLHNALAAEHKFEIHSKDSRLLPLEGMHFFTPLKGAILKSYEVTSHPYLEVMAPENSVVASVLEGTVISAGWNDGLGHTIRIQHSGDLVSVYTNCQKILKKAGDKVNAGTPIAMSGGMTGGQEAGALGLALWHKGETVDPARYISF